MDWTRLDRKRAETDKEYRDAWRKRCQTDHLFLGRLLGYTKLREDVHGPAAALCVQKDPRKPLEQQTDEKEFLHLDPRGVFKTTLSIIDSVQWIICFPEVRICKLTATKPLAKAIAGEITDHFVCGKDEEKNDFQFLFSEFLITPSAKVSGEYTAPCRRKTVPPIKEATVMAFSNETTISGWHFDVIDPDDVVDTQNSKTPTSLLKVKENLDTNSYTGMPWTYFNYKGTRYNPFDLWGTMLQQVAKGRPMKVLVRSALKLKNGKPRLEPGQFPPESEMELLFPEFLPYNFLKAKFEKDYSSFMTQYMNDAFGGNEVIFTGDAMAAARVPVEQTPITGETFIAWRFPYGENASTMQTGGAVGIIENGRMYVVDAVRGIYKPSVLAHEVVMLAKKWGSNQVQIEDTPGARYFDAAITNYAVAMNWPLTITWTDFQEDGGARTVRMKGMEPLVASRRLLFSAEISEYQEVLRQFENFGMIDDNELADVISRISERLPRLLVSEENSERARLNYELAVERDMADRLYHEGRYAHVAQEVEEKPYQPEPNSYGLHDIMPGLNG